MDRYLAHREVTIHDDSSAAVPLVTRVPQALAEWRAHLLARLHRQAQAAGDPRLAGLHDELAAYPGGESTRPAVTDVVVPLRYRSDNKELSFISITAVVGTPTDITVSELAIESFYPADEATAAVLS